jgi:hypothetical protein
VLGVGCLVVGCQEFGGRVGHGFLLGRVSILSRFPYLRKNDESRSWVDGVPGRVVGVYCYF